MRPGWSHYQSDEVDGRVVVHDGGFVQREMLNAAPAFDVLPSRSLDENATHQLRGDGEECARFFHCIRL